MKAHPQEHARRTHWILALAAGAGVCACTSAARADNFLWLPTSGGNWATPGNWDPAGPPGINDQAVLPGSGSGTINLGGSVHEVDTLYFQPLTSGYSIADGTLDVRSLTNAGDETNIINVDVVRPRTDIFGQRLYISVLDNLMPINSPIVDGVGGPSDVHAHARFTNHAMYTGTTQVWDRLELAGAIGKIDSSPSILAWGSAFALENSLDVNNDSLDNDFNFNRVPDTSTVQLKWGRFEMNSRNNGPSVTTETIGQLELTRGSNQLNFTPVDADHQIALTVADAVMPLVRDSTLAGRATAVIADTSGNVLGGATKIILGAAPGGMIGGGTITSIVPYLSAIGDTGGYMPVTYDAGGDGTIGNSDDVGLRPLSQFELTDMNSLSSPNDNAAANSSFTVSTPRTVNSLTFTEGNLTLDAELTVNSGAVFYSSSGYTLASGEGGLNFGSAEGIIHTNGNEAYFDTPIRGSNGLTIAGQGTVWLTRVNSYTGGTVVNGGKLVLGDDGVLGGGDLVLVDADLQLEYAPLPNQPINNNIVFENWINGPLFGSASVRNFQLVDDSTLTLNGKLEGNGIFQLGGSNVRLVLTNTTPSNALATPDVRVNATQTLQVDGVLGNLSISNHFSGVEVHSGGALVGGGTIDGYATIYDGAVLRPGDTQAGKMTIRRFILLNGGTAELQLGGHTRGVNYDAIDVLDFGAELSGTVALSPLNGFVPQVGDRFEILTATGGFTGGISIVDGFSLPGGELWKLITTPGSLTVTIGGHDGDANFDGKVDIQDLYRLALNWHGLNKLWTDADFNFDGTVNGADLGILAGNWQYGVGSPGQPLDAALAELGIPTAGVPEPGVAATSFLLAALLKRTRRRV